MKVIFLVVSVVVVLVYGDLVMKKVDAFLEKNQVAISLEDVEDR